MKSPWQSHPRPSLAATLTRSARLSPEQLDLLAEQTHQRQVNRQPREPARRNYDITVSVARRRRIASLGMLPPAHAQMLTTAQQAVAAVIMFEQQAAGACNAAVTNIAVRAGVCRRTAQRALRRLVELKIINAADRAHRWARNVLTVASTAITDWIARRGAPLKRLTATNLPPYSHQISKRAEPAKERAHIFLSGAPPTTA